MTRGLVALTRPVSARLAECELSHLPREPLDAGLAARQHGAYEDVLRSLGCDVVRLPALDDHPDGVFVEDTLVVLDEVAIVTRPGAPSRRKETAGLETFVRPWRPVAAVRPPATLDGGDVLRIGRTLYVGLSGRTTAGGVAELERIAGPFGYGVSPVPVAACLHLKSAVTLVADDLLVANPDWIDLSPFGGLRVIPVHPDEPFAANALRILDAVIHPAGFGRTRDRLERAGLSVAPVDVTELARAEGGVTCCSVVFPVLDQAS